ncbi:MAG TPA: signal peptidase I [Candidatus Binatia bacterium]
MSSSVEPAPSISANSDGPGPVARQRRGKSAVREYTEAGAVALLLALVVRSSVVQAFKIPSGSMLPTLKVGDHILVNKFIYGLHLPILGTRLLPLSTPHRGDVVVFVYPVDPSKDFIKRVVGVAGDVVQVREKHVYINGAPWDDPYGYFADGDAKGHDNSPRDNYGPVTIPPEHVFVMGDNRDRSYDSRFWGFVDVDEVKGKAFAVYWSWDGTDRWARWERIGALIR